MPRAVCVLNLSVDCVLHPAAESLKLTDQKCRQQRQTVGTDEIRDHQNDDAVLHGIQNQNPQSEHSDQNPDHAQDGAGDMNEKGEEPQDHGEQREHRCE